MGFECHLGSGRCFGDEGASLRQRDAKGRIHHSIAGYLSRFSVIAVGFVAAPFLMHKSASVLVQ